MLSTSGSLAWLLPSLLPRWQVGRARPEMLSQFLKITEPLRATTLNPRLPLPICPSLVPLDMPWWVFRKERETLLEKPGPMPRGALADAKPTAEGGAWGWQEGAEPVLPLRDLGSAATTPARNWGVGERVREQAR